VVLEKLDSMVQASSLVELVNAFSRPALQSSKGPSPQDTLNLRMFYHHHRRDQSGKRQGKAPLALLTGKAGEADWVTLCSQHTQETAQAPSVPARTPLALGPQRQAHTTPAQAPSGPASLEPSTASARSWSLMEAEAASIVSS